MGTTGESERRMTAKRFHAQPGVGDWRMLYWGAHAHYACESFSHAARLVAATARVAAEVGHEPDVDVRPDGITIRTFSQRNGSLTAIDAELARRVSEAVREAGGRSDPSKLMMLGLAVAQDRGVDVRPFWS